MTRCGFVSILGLANAGKSTLLNRLVGQKVSIVSPKAQTTRRRILGIALREESQIIFMDTPGIFQAKRFLDKAMVKTAFESGKESDILLWLVDSTYPNLAENKSYLDRLPQKPLFLVLNKVDLLKDKAALFNITQELSQNLPQLQKTFMVSSLQGNGTEDLLETLGEGLPESPWLFPEDQITDLPQRIWASEITREHLYHCLQHELPYQAYVESESWEEFEDGSVKINQCIVTARDSQKPIILGKKGSMIKTISQKARKEMQEILGRPVHLFLYVKVREGWMDKTAALMAVGIQ